MAKQSALSAASLQDFLASARLQLGSVRFKDANKSSIEISLDFEKGTQFDMLSESGEFYQLSPERLAEKWSDIKDGFNPRTSINFVDSRGNVTMVRPWRSAATALSSTNEPDSSIRGAGHDQPGAGVNRRWFGSISRQMNSMNQGRYLWCRPPERQPRSDNFPESHRGMGRRADSKCVTGTLAGAASMG